MLPKLIILGPQSRIVPSDGLPNFNSSWTPDADSTGLYPEQQMELMREVETSEAAIVEQTNQQSHRMFSPPRLSTSSVKIPVQEHGNGMSNAAFIALTATPSLGPTNRISVGLHHFVEHYRMQESKGTIPKGWQQSVAPEERGQLALQFFTQSRLLMPKHTELVATRASLSQETRIFMAARDKKSYVSMMKQQMIYMTTTWQQQLQDYEKVGRNVELGTDRSEHDNPEAPRPTNSPSRANDRDFDDPSTGFTDMIRVESCDESDDTALSTSGNVGGSQWTSTIERVFVCPEPRCGEKFKGNSDLKYVYFIPNRTMSLMHFQKTSARAREAVQVRHIQLQAW
jgi:hypothetical protein